MNDLYEALEVCLQDIEQGADIETVLFRYPALAGELRPILEASANARGMAVPAPSLDVLQRNRAEILQRAAEMREARSQPVLPLPWFASLRRVAVTLVIIAMVFASGTGLVRAASATLPGDNLYPVKRTWEDVSLLFTLNLQQRSALEIQHENERLEELNELFAEKRSEEVDFAGLVTGQHGDQWLIAGFPVLITAQTELPDQPIVPGNAVRVRGMTQAGGVVLAERVGLLPPGSQLPDADQEPEIEKESNEGSNQANENNSGSAGKSSQVDATETPEGELEHNGSNSGSGNDNGSDHSGNDNSSEDNSNSGGNSGSDGGRG